MLLRTSVFWGLGATAVLRRTRPPAVRSRPPVEASAREAQAVICQTGCLSHGEYWRVQDHCQRTGKTCVLVEQPDALRIVRIHRGAEGGDKPAMTLTHGDTTA